MRVLITGGTGFVGAATINQLVENNEVVAAVRRKSDSIPKQVKQCVVGEFNSTADWSDALVGVEFVVHTAARAHIMDDIAEDPLAEFRTVNVEGTLNLARQGVIAGVKRFVFISSIKVNGEETLTGAPFFHDDAYVTMDPYGISKREAEHGLLALAKETDMDVVIIRPPLVYGTGVKANFLSMMKWIHKGVPLPFGAIHNQRSLVALDNLVSFIIHCIEHPKAANEVFLISDGEDVSTTELLQKVAKAFDKRSMLIPIPVSVMTLVAKLLGKADVANRLFGSLQVDSSKARDLLGWEPVITMDEQLKKTADAFLDKSRF